jgi:hypothetical protein
MSTTAVVVIVLVVIVVLVALALLLRARARRREHLQGTFGSEYDRAVEDSGSRRRAETELAERERRHAELQITPLSPARRERFRAEWAGTQTSFVDRPTRAVGDADRLVTELMGERGYPTGDFDAQVADLSVEHHDVLDHYREAHRIGVRSDDATTEELRQAMVHYRALFDRLLDAEASTGTPAETPAAAGRPVAPTDLTTDGPGADVDGSVPQTRPLRDPGPDGGGGHRRL